MSPSMENRLSDTISAVLYLGRCSVSRASRWAKSLWRKKMTSAGAALQPEMMLLWDSSSRKMTSREPMMWEITVTLVRYPDTSVMTSSTPMKAASACSRTLWLSRSPPTRREASAPMPVMSRASAAADLTAGWLLSPR